MFGDYNNIINAVVAIVLALAPQLVDKPALDRLSQMSAQARTQAEHIIVTGDTAALKDMESALNQLQAAQAKMGGLSSVVNAVVGKVAPTLASAIE